ncbi:hypothetical protein Tsubulata_045552 [Turnera subulata]|uniref:Uncharacterized protein n=1 Tax=Turnera subulata TaxID=218843 RepID=A0A9Q0JH06_9ROSI|nr:hypothetical protein Tsubulata_045552 [Turnera subulata]
MPSCLDITYYGHCIVVSCFNSRLFSSPPITFPVTTSTNKHHESMSLLNPTFSLIPNPKVPNFIILIFFPKT